MESKRDLRPIVQKIKMGWLTKNSTLPEEVMDQDTIFFGFLFHSEYGNNCHFDNLMISGIDTTYPYIDFYASPLTSYVDSIVTFSDSSKYGTFSSWEWNFGENAIPETATGKGPHEVSYATSGRKTVSLLVDGLYSRTKEEYVTIEPTFPSPQGLTAQIIEYKDVRLTWDPDNLFEDGFESGDFSLWHEVIQGSGSAGVSGGIAYWYVQGDSVQYIYEGDYGALVDWGYTIDTWIISPQVAITDQTIISFIWNSSYYWHVDPFDSGDLFVLISVFKKIVRIPC